MSSTYTASQAIHHERGSISSGPRYPPTGLRAPARSPRIPVRDHMIGNLMSGADYVIPRPFRRSPLPLLPP